MRYFIATLIAIVVIGVGAYYFKNQIKGQNISQATVATNQVQMQNMAFSPNNITIKTGETVVFTNNDSVDHTVTANNNSWDSGNLKAGGTFSHTFDTAGTFSYHCTYHTNMTGQIIVQ